MSPSLSLTLLRTQTDARLLALARQGHERAFEAIVERYRRPLGRVCRRMLSESRAEDALQQTFLNAWASLDRGAEIQELKPWLYRIAHNVSINAVRRSGYDYEELSASLTASAGADSDLERRQVIRETLTGLAGLPERQRQALLATAVDGRAHADVGAEMGLSDTAVRQLVHRARTALRAAATAITPSPLALWLAQAGASEGGRRALEIAAGTGGAGAAAGVTKFTTALVAAGAFAGAAPGLVEHPERALRPKADKAVVKATASRPASAPAVSSAAAVSLGTRAVAGAAPGDVAATVVRGAKLGDLRSRDGRGRRDEHGRQRGLDPPGLGFGFGRERGLRGPPRRNGPPGAGPDGHPPPGGLRPGDGRPGGPQPVARRPGGGPGAHPDGGGPQLGPRPAGDSSGPGPGAPPRPAEGESGPIVPHPEAQANRPRPEQHIQPRPEQGLPPRQEPQVQPRPQQPVEPRADQPRPRPEQQLGPAPSRPPA